ncbi:MAG: mechanosensitive ion channel family protein, partial [Proteobacteria bacterium]|nr:mechanosensitive ion channel family protein [Pseudomonadota bacterium]
MIMDWEFLKNEYLGNPLRSWAMALAVFTFGYFLVVLIVRFLGGKLASLSKMTISRLDDMIADQVKNRTSKVFIFFLALNMASQVLTLPEKPAGLIRASLLLALTLQLGIWGSGIINYVVRGRAARDGEDSLNLEAYSVLTFIIKTTMWVLLVLLALNNLGIQITTLIAGLGVGGIAVALALQNILGDLFASLSIVLDRPFIIGDFIIVGDQMGNVEHVGLKTTRVRSLSGEQLIFSNTDLLASRIKNYQRMEERRVFFKIGVIYQTPREKLEKIPGLVQGVIEGQELTRFDRAHFSGFGDFSLDFEFVYYVLDKEFNVYRDVQQKVLLGVHRVFEEEGVEFAYPTQTVFLER